MGNINYHWNWSKISDRKDLKLSLYLLNNPNLNWDWNKLSLNPYINSDVVEKLIDKPWNWSLLSLNISMDWDFIEKYIDKPWDWQKLSFSLITTWDIIINNLNNKRIKWDWISICLHNPNITFKHVIEHPELPWNFRLLSQNRMGYSYKMYDYDVLNLDILLLKILSNKSLPDYLQMEILINDHFRFTEYEIFSLL